MKEKEIYKNFADHLSKLSMSFPVSEELIDILKEMVTPLEAEVAMALPNRTGPLRFVAIDKIPKKAGLSKEEVLEILEKLSDKGIVFTGKTDEGNRGFALWQPGFGFPQVFHWKGDDTPYSRKMAELSLKYFQNPRVGAKIFCSEGTKPYRYIPIAKSIEVPKQGVYSQHMMEEVMNKSRAFALGHCPCRVSHSLLGQGCDHPTDVCLKFNDMAEFLIEKGLAKELSKEEALEIIQRCEEIGLVHFVDNAEGNIQHNCNCCGCVCWNLGPIKRRVVPRDLIMATYFLRTTDEDKCSGCGECVDICPIDAVKMEDDIPLVDLDWCIGCGVCSKKCSNDAIKMVARSDKKDHLPKTFRDLHEIILEEKGLT